MELRHIALGTMYRGGVIGRRTIIDAPWEVYAVGNLEKLPHSFYEMRLSEEGIVYCPLECGTPAYNKVFKWVKDRNIFTLPNPRCLVSRDEALELLLQNQAPKGIALH